MKEDIEKIRKNATKILPSILNLILNNIDIRLVIWFKFRIKTIDSYIKRMERFNQNIGEVDDLIGFCIVAKNISNCYKILNQIKKTDIIITNIKDYIESPCGINYYQAIHVKYKYENTLGEIQIKTEKMAEVAEKTYNKYKNK